MLTKEEIKALSKKALEMREKSYCPYSGFAVGAGLMTIDGEIIGGCNIENAAYTPGNCGERTAIFNAVSQGKTKFKALAIAGGKKGSRPSDYCPPCGVCRQVIREFCGQDFPIILTKSEEDYKVLTLSQLLPESFGPEDLEGEE